ncbi:MAG: ribonuclease Z [Lachnospiraceae bacterium]|nr:ribonuclease Z [Lachnospiraceae bacterium]
MIEACLLGTGGMMPLPYRWLTSLMVRYQGTSILVDCGEATQIAMRKKGWSPKPIDVMCFTHYHADHISGLPGMLLTMGNAEKDTPLLMVGPKGLQRVVSALRVIAPEVPFPIEFYELSKPEEVITLPDHPTFTITAFRVNHNVTCYGYRFDLSRIGKFDMQAAEAMHIQKKYWNRLQHGETLTDESGRTLTPDMVLGAARKGLRLTYTTDTRPTKSIVENARDADLFICEGMYGEPDKDAQAREKKHMTFTEAAELAKKAQVKELWLTHYSPSLNHPADYLHRAKAVFPNTVAAKDGRSVDLLFTEEPEDEAH